MSRNADLKSAGVRLFPQAISQENGVATFHITDVDYENRSENTGTSSLLIQEGRKIKEAVEVETRRLDSFVRERHPEKTSLALWIDVEGAEHGVLAGLAGIADEVVAVHVEAAERPQWHGQRPLRELKVLMESMGFVLCGSNITSRAGWGDVVFIRETVKKSLGLQFRVSQGKGYVSHWLRADHLAVFLKERLPWLYRALRSLYLKVGT